MKVTFTELLPLDGAGTMLHPAYKWLRVEREEVCSSIQKAGNMYYMMSSQGFVIHSVDVEKIRKIEFADMVVSLLYDNAASYPFMVSFDKTDGTHYSNMGSKEFSSVLESIRQYTNIYNRK
jgi:hypothetical protein